MQRGCETLSRYIQGSKRRQIATATRLQTRRASPALKYPRRRRRGVAPSSFELELCLIAQKYMNILEPCCSGSQASTMVGMVGKR